MRDWRKLRPASFRGAAFRVDEEAIPKTGRRVAVHQYVKAEEHGTEDMGRLPREFRIRAYIASDNADAACQALMAACGTPGAATLVLPFFGGHQVRCTGCGPSWNREKLGYVSIDIEFVEAGSDGASFPAIAIGDRIAAGALDALPGLVADRVMAAASEAFDVAAGALGAIGLPLP